jgi:hypothetical protein
MGRIFDPAAHAWARSHAQVPTPLLYDDKVRVFYADRYEDGRSYTTFVDLDRRDLSRVIYAHKEAILPFGEPGAFDDDGIMPGHALHRDGQVWLYYNGWNRGVTVPYRNSVGVAVSDDGGTTFRKLYEGPVLDRAPREPHMAVTPTILREGDLWRMWYVSGLRWALVEGNYEPVYVIKYAQSTDGVAWERPNLQCISQSHSDEAFAHPTVVRRGDEYLMWYAYRDSKDYRDGKGAYRIGFATSPDGLSWLRRDSEAGMDHAAEGWDSTMTTYPAVLKIDGRIVMFYNGNGFGRSGFGYAILEHTHD